MKSHHGPVLLVMVVAGAVLAGCTGADTPVSRAAAAAAPAPSPTGISAQDQLVAALRKTHKTKYAFSVRAEAPDKERVRATGSVDVKAKKFSTDTKITGGKYPQSLRRIVIGNAIYDKQSDGNSWAHVDMKRLKKNSYLRVNMADPIGLAAFTSAIESVERVNAHAYRGTFNPSPSGVDDFLPVGAPIITVFGGTATFTAATDAQGWITKIGVELRTKDTLTMTTTFSGHGKPLSIAKPKNVGEVYDFYYD